MRVDHFGDPLPAGAIARLGTVRLRLDGGAYALAFSPDSKTIAVGGKSGRIRIWEVATGRQVGLLEKHQGSVSGLAFSPDGKTVASSDYAVAATVRFWDVATRRELRRWKLAKRGGVYRIAFSPDGKRLASGWLDGTVSVSEIATGKVVHKLKVHTDAVNSLAFSPDGKLLATGCYKEPPGLWDTMTGKRVRRFSQPVERTAWLNFSTDGRTLAVGGNMDACHIWEMGDGEKPRQFKRPSRSVNAISPDNKIAAVTGGDSRIDLVDLATGRNLQELFKSPPNGNFTYGGDYLRFSPDGSVVALRSSYGSVLLWDAATGKPLPGFDLPRSRVESIAASPDGERIAVRCQHDPIIRIWETKTGKQRLTIPAERDVAFAPDGKVIAAANYSEIVLHSADSGKPIRKLRFEKDVSFFGVTYGRDGRSLAAMAGLLPRGRLTDASSSGTRTRAACCDSFGSIPLRSTNAGR